MSPARVVGLALPLGLAVAAAGAGEPAPPLEVGPAAGEIHLDGNLSDPGRQGAAGIDSFWDVRPGDNVSPKAKTTAWVTYDERSLYIAVRCDDHRTAPFGPHRLTSRPADSLLPFSAQVR